MNISTVEYIFKKIFKIAFAKRYFKKHIKPLNKKYSLSKPNNSNLNKILYLNTYLGIGGAAKIAYNLLCKRMQQRNLDSKILVNNFFNIKKDTNIILLEKESSRLQKLLYKAMFKLGWLDFFHLSSFNLRNLKEFKECDIFHINNIHGNYFNPYALPELTALKPTIWTIHDMHPITGHCAFPYECDKWNYGCKNCTDLKNLPEITKDEASFLYESKKQIYENCDFTIVCYSKWMKNNLEKSILKDKDIRLIYNGIDTNIFKPYDKEIARKDLGLPQDKKILLFASNCSLENKQKGGKYLFDLYNKLSNRDDILIIALGNETRKKISQNFLCVEYIEDENIMAKYYSAADVFVFPTLAESFGLVIAESMACATPVVSFNVGPVPEIIEHNTNGYIANYKDTEDFTKGVETLINNRILLESYSNRARASIINKFSLEKMTNEYTSLYKEVLEKRCKNTNET